MENNYTDKQLRDKLKSVEAPFDPQAWEQMETMLDKNKKRRGAFWWWFSGVAACLLLATVIGYESMKGISNENTSSNTKNTNTNKSTLAKNENPNQPITYNSSSQPNTNYPTNENRLVNSNALQPGKERESIAPAHAKKKAGKAAFTKVKNNTGSSGITIGNTRSQKQKTHAFAALKNTGDKTAYEKNRAPGETGELVANKNLNEQEISNLTSALMDKKFSEIYLEKMNADPLIGPGDDGNFKKSDDDLILPKKKKIFHYSLGAIANITFTSIGNQASSQLYDPNNITTHIAHPHVFYAPFFYNQPSFAVGITQQFTFGKWFAITNSVQFSQTGYRVFYTGDPYTIKAIGLDVPIGLKFYPVSKARFRFYIESGFINHFTFQRSFSYPPVISYNYTTGSLQSFAISPSMAPESTIIKTYYASFYATAGVEFVVKSRFVIFTAPLFYMSLHKITGLESYKYNLGLTGGFRYQF